MKGTGAAACVVARHGDLAGVTRGSPFSACTHFGKIGRIMSPSENRRFQFLHVLPPAISLSRGMLLASSSAQLIFVDSFIKSASLTMMRLLASDTAGQCHCSTCRCMKSSLIDVTSASVMQPQASGRCYKTNCVNANYLQVRLVFMLRWCSCAFSR